MAAITFVGVGSGAAYGRRTMVAVAVELAVAMAFYPSSSAAEAAVAFVDGAILFLPIFFSWVKDRNLIREILKG